METLSAKEYILTRFDFPNIPGSHPPMAEDFGWFEMFPIDNPDQKIIKTFADFDPSSTWVIIWDQELLRWVLRIE